MHLSLFLEVKLWLQPFWFWDRRSLKTHILSFSLNLSPFVLNASVWSLSSSSLFTIKSFFLALSNHANQVPLFLAYFLWKSQVLLKVKSFVWLVAHKKVNTNDILQLRRSYKALNLDICLLCKESGESVNHLFLHCPLTLGYDIDYSNWLIWTRFLLGVCVTWWPSHINGWEIPLEVGFYGKPLVLLWFGLCRRKETLGFFTTRWKLQRFFGILFISLLPFGPLIPQLLRVFTLI